MKKALIIATTLAVLGGSAVAYTAYAQGYYGHGRYRADAADLAAFADARIAALRAGLALNADQQKLWPPVETALKEMAKKRIDTREKFRAEMLARRESGVSPDPVERMRRGADRMAERSSDLKKLADATQPLYASLDEAQKRRFDALARAGMRNQMHEERRHWRRFGQNEPEHRMGPRHHDRFDRDGRQRTGWQDEDHDSNDRI
jgi:hypothetical protein